MQKVKIRVVDPHYEECLRGALFEYRKRPPHVAGKNTVECGLPNEEKKKKLPATRALTLS